MNAYVPDPTVDAFTSYLRETVRGQWSQWITVSPFTVDAFHEAIKSLEQGPKFLPSVYLHPSEYEVVHRSTRARPWRMMTGRERTGLPHRIGPRGARKLWGGR